MNLHFYDYEELEPQRVLTTSFELSQFLEKLRKREAFICDFKGENGYKLSPGISDRIGRVQYSTFDDMPPYMMALAKEPIVLAEYEFLMGQVATPVQPRFCLPFDDVKRIILYFGETGGITSEFEWEEI